ncbi:MAG TPA: carboxypeptidase regulatory-like domain-containing protein [Terriglobia bacterium]|nr:carboxypeptidase regulatory-like domain-containing protein [Terriglobia bacterium]
MRRHRLSLVLGFAFWFLLASGSLRVFGQVITGDILGTVRDASGAVVPGAKVVLTDTGTGVQVTTATDAKGSYLFPWLKPAHYSVTVSRQGFQTSTISDIDLLVGQRPREDVVLRVGRTTQTVSVSAGGVPLLETQTSSAGQVISQQFIQQLPTPIGNGRSFMELAITAPAAQPIQNGNSPATSWTGIGDVSMSVAGMRESDISYLIDGIETRNARFGAANQQPSLDTIQEFKMQTDGFSAEYGRSAAVANMTIKSGTNAFHGDAYEFLQNNVFNSNAFFANEAHQPVPPLDLNDFGATFGGPIIHSKTFFFFGWEDQRYHYSSVGTALLPSPGQWNGDLADNSDGTAIFPTSSSFCQSNPGSSRCLNVINPLTGQPFPGNIIPTSMLDARAQKWHTYTPTPNYAPAVNATTLPLFNYSASVAGYLDFNKGSARIDQTLGSKDHLYGSYNIEDVPHTAPGIMPLSGASYPLRSQVASLTEDHIFSPTIVNEFRFGYNRGKTFLVGLGSGTTNYAAQFGYTNTSSNPFDFGVPDAGISGFTGPGSSSESIGAIDQDFQFVDNLSVMRGSHDLEAGVDVMRERFFQITDFAGIPSFSFTGQFTGSSLGDMLLGIPFTATTSVGNSAQDLRTTYSAAYFEDDWRVKPDLTLNLGIRYEYANPPWDKYNHTEWFNPAIGQIQYSSLGQVRNGVINPDYDNIAPRMGFAWSPSFLKKTVVRAAGGIFYGTDNWNELQFMVIAPLYYSSQTLTSSPTKPTLSLENLFPVATPSTSSSAPFSLDKENRTPRVFEWTLDMQHRFGGNWMVDLGYLGNRGNELDQRTNLDAGAFDPSGTIPLDDRVPFPSLSYILWGYNGGWSSYNGLTASLEKRFSSGLDLMANYTYSHCIDLGNTDDFTMAARDYDVYDKGQCDYNPPQRATVSYVYDLPVGPGRRFLAGASGIMGRLSGGWAVSGITTFQSGQFMSVTLPTDWMNVGSFTTNVPNKIGPAYFANRTLNDWLNISSFVYPGCPSYTPCANGDHVEGDSGRNQIEEPGYNYWNIGVLKTTRISERFSTEFRAEFYNAFNHPNFSPPDGSLVPGEFGRISGTDVYPRTLQFGLKLLF